MELRCIPWTDHGRLVSDDSQQSPRPLHVPEIMTSRGQRVTFNGGGGILCFLLFFQGCFLNELMLDMRTSLLGYTCILLSSF